MENLKLSIVILTKNEERNIERCLRSLNFCDEIVIVDDYSTDKTIAKIKNLKFKIKNYNEKLKIFKKHLEGNFANQRNFGLEKTTGEWILFVDADEEVPEELRNEIARFQWDPSSQKNTGTRDEMQKITAFRIKRRDWFWGREVKFGEIPRWVGLIRLVQKNSGKWEGRVHERFQVKSLKSKVQSLKHFINHYPHPTVKEFLEEINFYSSLRAEELYESGKKTNILEIIFYPLGKFILNYFFKLGFLDGAAGFVYGFAMSFHSFLVRTKLYMLKRTDLK